MQVTLVLEAGGYEFKFCLSHVKYEESLSDYVLCYEELHSQITK